MWCCIPSDQAGYLEYEVLGVLLYLSSGADFGQDKHWPEVLGYVLFSSVFTTVSP
jgi:hypothetical protein